MLLSVQHNEVKEKIIFEYKQRKHISRLFREATNEVYVKGFVVFLDGVQSILELEPKILTSINERVGKLSQI